LLRKSGQDVKLEVIVDEGASGGLATLWDLDYMDMEDTLSRQWILTLKFKVKGSGESGYV
jgi:hypothetical protein